MRTVFESVNAGQPHDQIFKRELDVFWTIVPWQRRTRPVVNMMGESEDVAPELYLIPHSSEAHEVSFNTTRIKRSTHSMTTRTSELQTLHHHVSHLTPPKFFVMHPTHLPN
jgi:hypothetical protein